jgi:hypothetical protein
VVNVIENEIVKLMPYYISSLVILVVDRELSLYIKKLYIDNKITKLKFNLYTLLCYIFTICLITITIYILSKTIGIFLYVVQ